jgi:hypothetical protein
MRRLMTMFGVMLIISVILSSCKRDIVKRIDFVSNQIDTIQNSIKATTNLKNLELLNANINSVKDSLYNIKKDKELKKGDIDELEKKIDSLDITNQKKKEQLKLSFALDKISGFYSGMGTTYYNVPNWGRVANGVFSAGFTFNRDNNSTIETKLASGRNTSSDISNFEIVDLDEVSEKSISGYLRNKENGVKFCSFTWYEGDSIDASIGDGKGRFYKK